MFIYKHNMLQNKKCVSITEHFVSIYIVLPLKVKVLCGLGVFCYVGNNKAPLWHKLERILNKNTNNSNAVLIDLTTNSKVHR